MKEYKDYVFDLYGTLIDIRTDEENPVFWRHMSGVYAEAGAFYEPEELRSAYLRLCAAETEAVAEGNGSRYPEPDLANVFAELYREKHLGHEFPETGWVERTALEFRSSSREYLRLYDGTLDTLNALRRKGKRLFLLSNAQTLFTYDELERTGLADLFDGVSISSEAGVKKPDPQFLRGLMLDYGISAADALFVGNDISSDIRIADACGMDSVYLDTWGRTEEDFEREIEEAGIVRKERVIRREGSISFLNG